LLQRSNWFAATRNICPTANIAPAWEILKRLSVRAPREGFGRLLRELPEMK